jgi:transcriptional regulator with XRE-family HTH domain
MSNPACVCLGRRIRECRLAKGWTQQILADHAELSKTHVCELEVGKREIGFLALCRIAAALDLKMSDLLKGLD